MRIFRMLTESISLRSTAGLLPYNEKQNTVERYFPDKFDDSKTFVFAAERK